MSEYTYTPYSYSPEQQEMVAKLRQAILQRQLTPDQYWTGYSLEQVEGVLAEKSPINPMRILLALWSSIFGDTKVEDIELADGKHTDKYAQSDIDLARKIVERLADPEVKQSGVTAGSVARSLGKTAGWFSQIVNGKYKADPAAHLRAIWATIEPAQIAAQASPVQIQTPDNTNEKVLAQLSLRYGDVPFVKTSMSELIDYTCGHARRARRFSVFAGAPGLGKTYGLQEYIRNNQQTLLIVGHEQMSAKTLLADLCRLLALPKLPTASRQMEAIIRTLHMADRVIILDEADKCKPNALDPLRTISDRARVGIVLIGNTKLTDRLQAEERYELIASRVCFWPTPKGQLDSDDIKTLFLALTQSALPMAADDANWWNWLHQRVEGNARLLCENLLPHLVSVCSRDTAKKVDRMLVNSIFKQVLNKPAL